MVLSYVNAHQFVKLKLQKSRRRRDIAKRYLVEFVELVTCQEKVNVEEALS
jgi:hypothetical protein